MTIALSAHAVMALIAVATPSAGGSGQAFRPPAVPLVSVEPHFSVWSAANRLYDVDTTHWSGARQPLTIHLDADGTTYRLCGRGIGSTLELPVIPQTGCRVGATVTSYAFADGKGLSAEIDFTTPRLTDDLDVFSRPVTYVTVRVKGAKEHKVRASISGAWATNDDKARMTWTTNAVAGTTDISVGRAEQTPFSVRGDRKRADWGRVHLVGPFASAPGATTYILAYDSGKSVRFFGKDLVDWWARSGKTFDAMMAEAIADASALEAKCRAFDAKFRADMEQVGGAKYADIAELSWRQSFAACKFVANSDGEPFMFSAENASGGMIGTTDVFYPQFPHLLMSSMTLAKASLAPTCIYAASTNWPYAYAPHDLGLFPVAEGQYYGMRKGQSVGGGADDTYRMPVEECGNMLILLASVAKAEGNAAFAGRWWGEVSKWADYLSKFGYDPGNQLCTDDFAGHLAHNANLSVKSIVALGAYALMADMRGEKDVAKKFRALAEGMVPKWIKAAKGGAFGGTRIAFDLPGTWSLKYNLAWDRVLGLGLFPPEVAAAELKAYRAVASEYGVPLDCRKPYTKADWIVWAGTLTGRREDLEFMCEGLHRFICETPDRIPFSDWYMADSGLYRSFIARSVVGGVFMPVLTSEETTARAAQRPSFESPNDFGVGRKIKALVAKAGDDWREVAERNRSTRLHKLQGDSLTRALQEMSRRYFGSDALDMGKVPLAELGEIAEAAFRGGLYTESYGWALFRWFMMSDAKVSDPVTAARLLAGFERGLAGVLPDDSKGECVTFSPCWKITSFQSGAYNTTLPGGGYFDSAWSNSMGSCSYDLRTSAKKVKCRIKLHYCIMVYDVMVNGEDVDFNGGAFTAIPDADGVARIRIGYSWTGNQKKKAQKKDAAK